MLAGGSDVDPASYGARPHPETGGTWPERDRFELGLVHRALERGMPVLGICRGMQMLNVAVRRAHWCSTCPTWSDTRTTATPRARSATTRCGSSRDRWPPARPARSEWRSSRTTTRAPTSWARASRRPDGRSPTAWWRRSSCATTRFALGVLWHPEEDMKSRVIAALVDAATAEVGAR